MTEKEIRGLLESGIPYVVRQKIPSSGETVFHDAVYGEISIKNSEIEDQILIKSDGYPTYNFANVVDDHLMKITHVVRGCEYLTSTPKYNLLYEALGWEKPVYVHLPLIVGKNPDGTTSKLSKRHGSTSFGDLTKEGYLSEAIINYIAMLGWCPKENREIYSLEELTQTFLIDGIGRSPAIFDYDKLNWFNAEYIRSKSLEEFNKLAFPYFKEVFGQKNLDFLKISKILHQRIVILKEIPKMIKFLNELCNYDIDIFVNKKSKANLENSLMVLERSIDLFSGLENWSHDAIYECLIKLANDLNFKNSVVMWPIRIAISGQLVTPGGAIEILDILGKDESLSRIGVGIKKLSEMKEP